MSEASTSYLSRYWQPGRPKVQGQPTKPPGSIELMQRLVYKLVRTAFAPFWLTLTLPYQTTLLFLTSACNALTRLLVLLGCPPKSYQRGERARDLARALEIMQQREELYRKKLHELRGELELRDKDRRKAMRKVKQLHNEVSSLQGHLAEVQDETTYRASAAAAAGVGQGVADVLGSDEVSAMSPEAAMQLQAADRAPSPSSSVMLSLVCLAFALWSFFSSDPQSVHKKIVTCTLFPTLYVAYGALQARAFGTYSLLTYCLCWFVVGFVVCNRFTAVDEP